MLMAIMILILAIKILFKEISKQVMNQYLELMHVLLIWVLAMQPPVNAIISKMDIILKIFTDNIQA